MSGYISRHTGKQIDDAVEKVLSSEQTGGAKRLVVELNHETGMASHTPTEIYDLYKQGWLILLNASGFQDSIDLFHLLSIGQDFVSFFQMWDDGLYYRYDIFNDSSYSYTEVQYLGSNGDAHKVVTVTLNQATETASHTPSEILSLVQNGRTVMLESRDTGSDMCLFFLIYCDSECASFVRVDGGYVQQYNLSDDGTFGYDEVELATYADIFPHIVLLDPLNGTWSCSTMSQSLADIYNVVNSGYNVIAQLREDKNHLTAVYQLSSASPDLICFYRITDDWYIDTVELTSDNSFTIKSRQLALAN